MSGVDVLAVEFNQAGDFQAIGAACAWCRAHGVSYGSMQRGSPIGMLAGDFSISKWRGMTPRERAALDGRITGDMRNGPVRVEICRAALARVSGGAA